MASDQMPRQDAARCVPSMRYGDLLQIVPLCTAFLAQPTLSQVGRVLAIKRRDPQLVGVGRVGNHGRAGLAAGHGRRVCAMGGCDGRLHADLGDLRGLAQRGQRARVEKREQVREHGAVDRGQPRDCGQRRRGGRRIANLDRNVVAAHGGGSFSIRNDLARCQCASALEATG